MKIILLLCVISFNAYAFNISSGISGSWYDKTNPGQGFNIEILEGNHIVVYWYSYDQGKPVWLVGSGTYQGNIATVELFHVEGSYFGIDHRNNLTIRQSFGTTIFTFDNCNSGSMTYHSSINFGSGALRLDRLTTLSGLKCTEGDTPTPTSEVLEPEISVSEPVSPVPVIDEPVPFSNKIVEVAGIRWEPGVCELTGKLTCNFKVISLNGDVEIELLSNRGGTEINVDGDLLAVQEVKLGNKISRSVFFGPKVLLKKNIALNAHIIFEASANSTAVIDFLNIAFKIDQEVFDIEYFNAIAVDNN